MATNKTIIPTVPGERTLLVCVLSAQPSTWAALLVLSARQDPAVGKQMMTKARLALTWWKMPTTTTSSSATGNTSSRRSHSLHITSRVASTSVQGGIARCAVSERCTATVVWPARASQTLRTSLLAGQRLRAQWPRIPGHQSLQKQYADVCKITRRDAPTLNGRPPGTYHAKRNIPRSLSSRRCSTSIFMPPVSITKLHNPSGQ